VDTARTCVETAAEGIKQCLLLTKSYRQVKLDAALSKPRTGQNQNKHRNREKGCLSERQKGGERGAIPEVSTWTAERGPQELQVTSRKKRVCKLREGDLLNQRVGKGSGSILTKNPKGEGKKKRWVTKQFLTKGEKGQSSDSLSA